jgi:thiol-disulfide isomerase/thioredoxin
VQWHRFIIEWRGVRRKMGMRKVVRVLALVMMANAPAVAGIIEDVRGALAEKQFVVAESALHAYRSRQGVTPEYLEALSWMGRASLAAKQFDQARAYAKETLSLTTGQLKTKSVDSDEHLATALGAAYEVEAQALSQQGKNAEATALIRRAIATYGATSIGPRLQKNLNMISLAGQPAPALVWKEFLGSKPVPLAQLKGKPVLLFFWAHWCADCKFEAPIVARLRTEFKDLVVVGPTQRYGYTAQDEHASPAAELKYIEAVRQKFYGALADMPVPVSRTNFRTYGCSTTPTMVLLDRQGKVVMYHPGALSYEELRGEILKVMGKGA